MTGPTIPIAEWVDKQKYRQEGESFTQKCGRVAGALTDGREHYLKFNDILKEQRFLPGGRVQTAAGSYRRVTAFNCFVMRKVPDSLMGIMEVATEAAKTMQMGGGVGYDFSSIRPKGARIRSLGSQASGPVSFMGIMDAICKTIASAGHRRGAQMGCLRVDHPDIMEFINSKTNTHNLTQFNISVLVTDLFMDAVKNDEMFDLVFEDRVFDTVRARSLWDSILRATWDWAEPGVIFIDRVNEYNNLWYCETISATNPCISAETPILTSKGYLPIIETVGEEVDIWNGESWEKVTPFKTGTDWLYRVHLSDGSYLDCTGGHKWCIEGEFVKTDFLEEGMKLDKFEMPVVKGFGPKHIGNAYSQGFYSGDGTKGYTRSWVYEPKYSCIPSLCGKVYEDSTNTHRKVWNHGPMLDKSWVPMDEHYEYRLAWLAGLLDSDGTVTRDKNGSGFQITSVDHDFLSRLQLMLTILGVRAKVVGGNVSGYKSMPDGRGGMKDYYCQETKRLLIGNYDSWSLMELGLKKYLNRLDHNGQKPQRDARRFVRVEYVENLDRFEDVYCFTEPKTSRGTFNGIVTGQCGEQPLPPYGACLLGSFNATKYIDWTATDQEIFFDWNQLSNDIPHVVRAMDNVIDETIYPLAEQEQEAKSKRRMGLGITGLANALEALGYVYGTAEAQDFTSRLLSFIANRTYMSSASLAAEKGPFPLFDKDLYLQGKFIQKLDPEVQEAIRIHGIRNSHLTSIAPTGTISLSANNVSSGLEPVFSHEYTRTVQTYDGPMEEKVQDYAFREWGIKAITADQIPVKDHVSMLVSAQEWVDSACSKTCNVGSDVSWEEFKDVYMQAYEGGAKGCTTFRSAGKRFGILNASAVEDVVEEDHEEDEIVVEGAACYIDPNTGIRSCDSV